MRLTRLVAITLSSLSILAACTSNPSKQDVGMVTGSVVGGVVGATITGGSTWGTVAGATAGGLLGNRVGKDLDGKRTVEQKK
jgi:osmotically inducible lipoprotein OsmB